MNWVYNHLFEKNDICEQNYRVKQKTINFDYGKHYLTANSKGILDKAILDNKNKNVLTITITGFTDSDGKDEYNDKLSKARAEEVLK